MLLLARSPFFPNAPLRCGDRDWADAKARATAPVASPLTVSVAAHYGAPVLFLQPRTDERGVAEDFAAIVFPAPLIRSVTKHP
jgi:hypothetical protein